MFLKTYNTEFDEIIIKFTDQDDRLLKKLIDIAYWRITRYSTEPRTRNYV